MQKKNKKNRKKIKRGAIGKRTIGAIGGNGTRGKGNC
jgi:hypothetical protein